MTSVAFLGHMVSKNSIIVDPVKIEAIHDWAWPISITEVWCFFGLTRYYKHLVEGFSTIVALLMQLNCQDIPFFWSEKCDVNFQRLKELLTTTPILTLLVEGEGYTVYYFASRIGLGCMLMQ